MSDEVIFRAVDGALKDEEFVFEETGMCLIGRSRDCALQIPKEKDMRISRRHCLLILSPPKIRIRDLGSRNGTYVNNEPLPAGTLGDIPEQMTPQDKVLNHGDRVNIGNTEFEILIPSQLAAGSSMALPPPGTKIIKLAKPEKSLGSSAATVKKSAPVDTGFFIPPPIAKGAQMNTSTAPLTEAFMKPQMNILSQPQGAQPAPPAGTIAAPHGNAAQPQTPAPGATLILKAKPPAAPPVAPAPPAAPVAPSSPQQPAAPRKVLKGRIVKKSPLASAPQAPSVPPPPAPPPPVYPGTEAMNVANSPDHTKRGTEHKKKTGPKKRVTKFKLKGPK